ncbi:unnamed protein product [Auanema sp. JU1783]|nr:unnamed protein product [Auanema sp. JU1783]
MHFRFLPTLLFLLTLQKVRSLKCYDQNFQTDICRFNPSGILKVACVTRYRSSSAGSRAVTGSVESVSWKGCFYVADFNSEGCFRMPIIGRVCICFKDLCNYSSIHRSFVTIIIMYLILCFY